MVSLGVEEEEEEKETLFNHNYSAVNCMLYKQRHFTYITHFEVGLLPDCIYSDHYQLQLCMKFEAKNMYITNKVSRN